MPEHRLITRHFNVEGQTRLATYQESGGYDMLRKALKDFSPTDLVGFVKESGLRGRGGAGFPTGVKWSFVAKNTGKPTYLLCNADESEPGTFKDRDIIDYDPHLLLEGCLIAAYAIDSETCYIYARGEFAHGAKILEEAIAEARQENLIGKNILGSGFNCDIFVYRGGGAYICGEETALIESLEGKRGMPRVKPPFPAIVGLYNSPTVVNNVETLAALPRILEIGVDAYKALGTEKSPGTKLMSGSGHVRRPGNFEVTMGTPLLELINDLAGGMLPGRTLKACIPGGSSVPVLPADKCDCNVDFESLAAAGSMLGSGGCIVMDDTTDMVWSTVRLLKFYEHESCGKCTPCREGTSWLSRIFDRILEGHGKPEDLELVLDICDNIEGNTVCPLGDAAVWPIQSSIKHFRSEWEDAIAGRRRVEPLPWTFAAEAATEAQTS
jgi:NADH-quinone oxidoreductase subunit F